ncbi:MAG: lysophospholipase [Proteobacteria bacterium]|nr:lysophospholipase [Pseudomonadota bacterium]
MVVLVDPDKPDEPCRCAQSITHERENMKMTLAFQILFYLLICYIFCALFMYLRQDSFIFYQTAARHENHNFDKVIDYHLERGPVDLRGWLVNPVFLREKLLIYYGGNAEDVFFNIEEYQGVQAATLFVAYRGYGPSTGKPGEAELFADALAVLDDIVSTSAPKEIYLIGRSLGSGVACHVAARRSVQGAILVTPYDSIENVARSHYPWLPIGQLLKHRFDSLGSLQGIRCPLLVIYGGRDRVIPPGRTENLIRHIQGAKEIVLIAEADHGTIEMFPEYWPAVLSFLHREKQKVE